MRAAVNTARTTRTFTRRAFAVPISRILRAETRKPKVPRRRSPRRASVALRRSLRSREPDDPHIDRRAI